MKSKIEIKNDFRPITLEITFESAFEMADFISRLKADNRLPNPSQKCIQQLEEFLNEYQIGEVR